MLKYTVDDTIHIVATMIEICFNNAYDDKVLSLICFQNCRITIEKPNQQEKNPTYFTLKIMIN